MNASLGMAGVVLAFVASLSGMVTVAHGLLRRRRNQARLMLPYSALALAGSVLAVVAMEIALVQRDFTIRFVAEHGSRTTPL